MSHNHGISEKIRRSVFKSVTWRGVALLDTVTLAFLFTGRIEQALVIGFAELLTKIGLYSLHERGWLRIARWYDEKRDLPKSLRESRWFSLGKTMTWRVVGSADTVLWSLIVTGSLSASLSIGTAEFLTKTVLFYLHERAWLRVRWGLRHGEHARQRPPLMAQSVLD